MKTKRPKTPATSTSKKVAIRDLKAKDAGSVKGGAAGTLGSWDIQTSKKI